MNQFFSLAADRRSRDRFVAVALRCAFSRLRGKSTFFGIFVEMSGEWSEDEHEMHARVAKCAHDNGDPIEQPDVYAARRYLRARKGMCAVFICVSQSEVVCDSGDVDAAVVRFTIW